MAASDYIRRYISECKKEAEKSHPEWLKKFFIDFAEGLKSRTKNSTSGNRYMVTGAFSEALPNLIPRAKDVLSKEKCLAAYVRLKPDAALADLIKGKKVDFVVAGAKRDLLIEFKTNLTFNDLAAAIVEMAIVKKWPQSPKNVSPKTASLHLFPFRSNEEGLRKFNESFDKQKLDHIFVFCDSDQQFRINEIKEFRKLTVRIANP